MPLLHLASLSQRARKSELLALIDNVGGLEGRRVGKIQLHGTSASVEVPEGWQFRLAKSLDGQLLGSRRIEAWASGEAAGHSQSADSQDEDHFDRLGRLLEIESKAEAQEMAERQRSLSGSAAERAGVSLVGLVVTDEESGLGGRYLVKLVKAHGGPLPWTRLRSGSPVVLSTGNKQGSAGYRGLLYRRAEAHVWVVLNVPIDEEADDESWQVHLSDNEVAVARQRVALKRAGAARSDRLAALRDVLLGEKTPEFHDEMPSPASETVLNDAQQDAVRFALATRDVALLHGPPGTGKTTVVVELIRQAIARGEKVLACAPSNMAVDNIVERLLALGVRSVRIGHPARVMPGVRSCTLDQLVENHPDSRLARKMVKEAMGHFRRAERFTRARPAAGEKKEARAEAKRLLADARRLENQIVEHVLDTSDVLCATTTGLDSNLLGARRFDLAVIDEACQSTEPGCWIPILRADRVVLAGDHCQLPPTVISRDAQSGGFGVSLFERLMAEHGTTISRRLTVQYRMNEAIMDFSSLEFYDGDLTADASVVKHRLVDLPHVTTAPLTEVPAELIDTAGAGYDELTETDGQSRSNPQEAALVCLKVQQLLDAGVKAGEIGVIVPYSAQVRLLRERLAETGIEIDSVDGFQGREKEAIVISLVRSNAKGEIGFLGDVRRMNVAMTRARRKLIMIGDSATLSSDPFYVRMLEYFESLGTYRTVWEEDGAV